MSSTPVNQDPALAPPPPVAPPPAGAPAAEPDAPQHLLDNAQIVQLLRHFPGAFQVGLIPPFIPSSSFPPWCVCVCVRGEEAIEDHDHRLVLCAVPRDSGGGSRLGHVRV